MTAFKKGDRVITVTEGVYQHTQMCLDGLAGIIKSVNKKEQVAQVKLDVIEGVLPFAFQELDFPNKDLYILIHDHCEGQTFYPFYSNKIFMGGSMDEALQKKLIKFFKINFEEDNDEFLNLEQIDSSNLPTY